MAHLTYKHNSSSFNSNCHPLEFVQAGNSQWPILQMPLSTMGRKVHIDARAHCVVQTVAIGSSSKTIPSLSVADESNKLVVGQMGDNSLLR
jgi:hypothetical protein